jgi:hypothetical protein
VEKSGSDGADGESGAGQDGVPDGARSFQHGRAFLIDCSHAQIGQLCADFRRPVMHSDAVHNVRYLKLFSNRAW